MPTMKFALSITRKGWLPLGSSRTRAAANCTHQLESAADLRHVNAWTRCRQIESCNKPLCTRGVLHTALEAPVQARCCISKPRSSPVGLPRESVSGRRICSILFGCILPAALSMRPVLGLGA